jgi:hypothetical protein
MVSLRAALCRLYHDRVLSNAECGGTEKRLYYIISYTVVLSNEPYAVRTPGTPHPTPRLEARKSAWENRHNPPQDGRRRATLMPLELIDPSPHFRLED